MQVNDTRQFLGKAISRQEHKRDARAGSQQRFTQGHPSHAGHVDVRQNKLRCVFEGGEHGFARILETHYIMIILQINFSDTQLGRVIVDNMDKGTGCLVWQGFSHVQIHPEKSSS